MSFSFSSSIGRVSSPGAMGPVVDTAGRLIGGPQVPADPNPFLRYALRFLTALQDAAGNLNPPEIAISQIAVPDQPIFLNVDPPSLTDITFTLPAIPTEFTGQLDIDGLLPQPFDQAPPELMFGAAPEAEFGPMPDAPGVNLDFVMPDLDLTLPSPPVELAIQVSQFSGVTIPAPPGDDEVPVLNLVAPTIREYVPGAQYQSALLTAVRTELLRRITEGGAMLNPDVEQALWDRGREREARATREAIDRLEQMETLGYAMPPGIYLDARLKIATETAAAHMGLSREIMIKQAELELEGVNKALELSSGLEAKQMDIANQIEQRAFEATRYATEAGVAIYNARVQAFTAFVDVYRAKVQAYEARIRGELARVEVYRTEIEAERLKVQINQARVDQFKIMTDAALSAVEVYKAQIMAIQSRAEIERLRVQVFGEQVKGYSARVNAFTARIEGFRVGVQAEIAKQDAFKAAVQVYGSQVDVASKVISARIAEFQARMTAKESEWRAYSSRASVESDRVRAMASMNEAVARVYSAEAGATSSFNEVLGRQWAAVTQAAINATNVSLEHAKANANLYMLQQSMIMDAAKVGATVAAQMGAAALSANSFSTSFSNARSVSANAGYSYGASNSYSGSRSDSHSTSDNRSVSEVKSLSV